MFDDTFHVCRCGSFVVFITSTFDSSDLSLEGQVSILVLVVTIVFF